METVANIEGTWVIITILFEVYFVPGLFVPPFVFFYRKFTKVYYYTALLGLKYSLVFTVLGESSTCHA